MNKLVAAYMVAFLIFSYFSSISEGGGGIVATRLTAQLSATATTLTVEDTDGFLTADKVIVDDEEITYNGKTATQLQNLVRGANNSDAVIHTTGRLVQSPNVGVINRAMGYNVISTNEAYGAMTVVNIGWNFFTKSLGHLVSFNFGILTGGELMLMLRYLFMAPAVGFVLYFAFSALGTAFGIINK